jgi:hypothetical protein
MRNADIKTMMDFYANVDEAVEAAVLGPQRNTSRNTRAFPAVPEGEGIDANRSGDGPAGP